ncbi:uncharacterized protein DSM5745_02709 [Aspergillus mulundensis]|uniref:ribonuclease H n=1 Tax=Aspergillus mulundensis TaxID=1810919 RepID=A0A3D8SIB3_9EURO|nr:hypothetical protein DSM5745_02709 [Aspergillus mulundensis]RDW86067.1 hypothetical protein DSM5745_02709 [Aspergillus mulundensis]
MPRANKRRKLAQAQAELQVRGPHAFPGSIATAHYANTINPSRITIQVQTVSKSKHLSSDDEDDNLLSHKAVSSHPARQSSLTAKPQPAEAKAPPNRRFHPEVEYPKRESLESVQVPFGPCIMLACRGDDAGCPCCGSEAHTSDIVIAFDGACSNNGKPNALSSIGVYIGPRNRLNISCTLNSLDKHTSEVAELEACEDALTRAGFIEAYLSVVHPLRRVVLKSDSEYVVRGVTEWLPKWKKNGFKNCRGLPVANAGHFKLIEWMIEQLEQDLKVEFWLVPRKMNQEADNLAKMRLKSDVPTAIDALFGPVPGD